MTAAATEDTRASAGWWVSVVVGIVLTCAGLTVVFRPDITLRATAAVVGSAGVAGAVGSAVLAVFRVRGGASYALPAFDAAVLFGLGTPFLFYPENEVAAFKTFVGVVLVLVGLLELPLAAVLPSPTGMGRRMLLRAAMALAMGSFLLMQTAPTIRTVVVALGAWLIGSGFVSTVGGFAEGGWRG